MLGKLVFPIEEQIIIASLRDIPSSEKADHLRSLYSPEIDNTLWQTAVLNRVTPIVGHALMDTFGADNIPSRWCKVHQENYDRITAYMQELNRVAVALNSEGVKIIIVENGYLARAVYPCPGCFEFGDLDFLVRSELLSILHGVLTSIGYKVSNFNSVLKDRPDLSNGRAEYEKIITDGYPLRLNFQWSLVARRWFDSAQEPNIETLFGRSVPISGCAARMLCPEDNLFQLTVHNASHAYIRKPGIRLHLDVARFVSRASLYWNDFVDLVQRYQVETQVYFSLIIPNVLFNTHIPDEVLRALRPPTWKVRLITQRLQRGGFFNPAEKKFGRLGYMLFAALLYDDLKGFWRAIFPDSAWMIERYGTSAQGGLPVYHIKRLSDLAFKRLKT